MRVCVCGLIFAIELRKLILHDVIYVCVLSHCGHSLFLFNAGNVSTIYVRSAVFAFAITIAAIVVVYSCRNFSFH